MPAALLPGAIEALAAGGRQLLDQEGLGYADLLATATPRRLVLYVRGLDLRQPDRRERVRGPAAAAAFAADGSPTAAALGFARSQGVDVASLRVEETPAGRYVFAERVRAGRPAAEILAERLPAAITGLEFPRSMRWGSGDLRFIRPIRWLVALLGSDVVPFAVAGVESGRVTRGHRVLGGGPVTVARAEDYFRALEAAGVIVDHGRRRDLIRRQVEEAAASAGGRPLLDEELLDEVTFLVEYPTAFAGRFDPAYLELPDAVLITPMKHHQRYFPVAADGRLLPAFVGVRNGGREHLDLVVAGNEKVLRARLADARFFFREDTRRPLADYVKRLEGIVFQARLGSMAEKVERVRSLAAVLADRVGADAELRGVLDRAAYLCKADLATSMVYEFPELQGIMGREYARRSGEPEAVAEAVFEHWLPRFAGDALPATPAGACLAVADKLDTICGCFAAGIQPTGSQDPYALRRQALGVIHTLRGGLAGLDRLGLGELVDMALDRYAGRPEFPAGPGRDALRQAVVEFFFGRIRSLMGEDGYAHEVVEAVLATGCDVPGELWRRASALTELAGSPELAEAGAAYRRAANLAEKAESDEVVPALLTGAGERALWEGLAAAEGGIRARAEAGDYAGYFAAYARLRLAVDRFLDETMVMVDDAAVRRNRLALLRRVARLGRLVADLGRLP